MHQKYHNNVQLAQMVNMQHEYTMGDSTLRLGMSQAPEKKNEKDGRIFDTK